MSKNDTGMIALCAGLPVMMTTSHQAFCHCVWICSHITYSQWHLRSPDHHVTQSLQQLHWFPVKQADRIIYKLCILTHQVYRGRSSVSHHLATACADLLYWRQRFRSATTHYDVPRTAPRTALKFGKQNFSCASPSAWNSLPKKLEVVDNPAAFRKPTKCHLFTCVYTS